MLVVASVFSPSMLGLEVGEQSWLAFKRVSVGEAKRVVSGARRVLCAISDPEYARAVNDYLELGLKKCRRRNIHVGVGDEMLVVIVKAPKTAGYDELLAAFKRGAFKIFHVRR